MTGSAERAEVQWRRDIAEEGIHSIEMENGTISPWMREKIQDWISGQTSMDQLGRMTLAHYGLEP